MFKALEFDSCWICNKPASGTKMTPTIMTVERLDFMSSCNGDVYLSAPLVSGPDADLHQRHLQGCCPAVEALAGARRSAHTLTR